MNQRKEMTSGRPAHIDTFSGIGGFALAAAWAGFETVAFSEVDRDCSECLDRGWPGVPNLGDISKADFKPYRGRATLFTGGFPCQPYAIPGLRRGKKDDRDLWPEMHRAISECLPTWVIGENSPNILNMVFADIAADLESLGYEVGPPLEIPACAVGAPHERNRAWILAYRDGLRESQQEGCFQKVKRRTEHGGEGMANSNGVRRKEISKPLRSSEEQSMSTGRCDSSVFLPDSGYRTGPERSVKGGNQRKDDIQRGKTSADIDCNRGPTGLRRVEDFWKGARLVPCRDNRFRPIKPGIPLLDDGVSRRLAQIKGYGNAIVPQVVYEILRFIISIETEDLTCS